MLVKNLNVNIGKKNIIRDISFSLEKGKIYVLLGKNGCGKTTLLKAISGNIKRKTGEILIKDKDLAKFKDNERAKLISYLPQNLPRPAITVKDLVTFGRYPYTSMGKNITKNDEDIINSSLIKTNMLSFKNQLVCHLSGGECQMAYLALLDCQNTNYVFLDEPFAALDLLSKDALKDYLLQLKNNGKTVLFSVHDLLLAIEIADEIILIDEGKMIQECTKDQFLESKKYLSIFPYEIKNIYDEEHKSYYVLNKINISNK